MPISGTLMKSTVNVWNKRTQVITNASLFQRTGRKLEGKICYCAEKGGKGMENLFRLLE
ncbi:MAG: hypothetical protein ACI8ZM_001028 [Crocinitomix sp.]|jgi:hypothetical protein